MRFEKERRKREAETDIHACDTQVTNDYFIIGPITELLFPRARRRLKLSRRFITARQSCCQNDLIAGFLPPIPPARRGGLRHFNPLISTEFLSQFYCNCWKLECYCKNRNFHFYLSISSNRILQYKK